jgi:hypothetical protein
MQKSQSYRRVQRTPQLERSGDGVVAQKDEMFGLAEKVGLVGRNAVNEMLKFLV